MAAAEFGSDKPPPPLTVSVVPPPSMPIIDSVTGSDGISDLTRWVSPKYSDYQVGARKVTTDKHTFIISATSPVTMASASATTPTMTPKVAVIGDGGAARNVNEFTAKKKVVHQLQMEVGRQT